MQIVSFYTKFLFKLIQKHTTENNYFFWARCAGPSDCSDDRDNGFICEREGKLSAYQ